MPLVSFKSNNLVVAIQCALINDVPEIITNIRYAYLQAPSASVQTQLKTTLLKSTGKAGFAAQVVQKVVI